MRVGFKVSTLRCSGGYAGSRFYGRRTFYASIELGWRRWWIQRWPAIACPYGRDVAPSRWVWACGTRTAGVEGSARAWRLAPAPRRVEG